MSEEQDTPSTQIEIRKKKDETSGIDVHNVITTNQLRQAPNLFQNTTFLIVTLTSPYHSKIT